MKRAGFAALVWAGALSTLALVSACHEGPSRQEKDYQNFLVAATRAPGDGYAMYWLGRSVTAGGLTFEGPGVSDFGGEQEGGGIEIYYSAPGGAGLYIGLLSDAAWAHPAPTPPRSTTKTVTVLGRAAELKSAAAGTRPVNVLTLTLALGNTHIVAVVHSIGAPTPGGPDANPLIDEQTFLTSCSSCARIHSRSARR